VSNPAKARGTAWESAIVRYLREVPALVHARRAVQDQVQDQGDVHVWPVVIQAKAVRKHALPAWVKAARAQADVAGFPWSVVYVKQFNKGTGEGYAVRSIAEDVQLVARLRELEAAAEAATESA